MKNLGQFMKQAQAMQTRMAEMQAELERIEMTGQSGGGMVKVTLNGKGEMRAVKIDPKLVDPAEVDVLEDLILAAAKDAKSKVEEHVAGEMSKLTGGLPLPPGMKLPF
jgi:DNA-binding YbaB/EbfC family protein